MSIRVECNSDLAMSHALVIAFRCNSYSYIVNNISIDLYTGIIHFNSNWRMEIMAMTSNTDRDRAICTVSYLRASTHRKNDFGVPIPYIFATAFHHYVIIIVIFCLNNNALRILRFPKRTYTIEWGNNIIRRIRHVITEFVFILPFMVVF